MRFQVIAILAKHYYGKVSQYVGLLGLFLAGTLLSTLAVGWDQHSSSVTFFGFPLTVYEHSREKSLSALLNELFSWAWILVALFYLSNLLKRLSESFSVNEMLWLRLVSCSPCEVAVARALWIAGSALAIGTLGTLWVLICSVFHHIGLNKLIVNVEGLVSHVLLSGGIVVALNSVAKIGESEQNSISVISLITPLLLTPIYIGINNLAHTKYMIFFPYTIPFNRGLQSTGFHFGVAALIGTSFLCLYAISKFRFSHVRIAIED